MKKSIHDLLNVAGDVIRERGGNYGGIEDNFQLISDLASLRLGRDIHPYEIAVMLCCVKNARSFASPDHEDSHVDAANYELFAAMFADDYALRAMPDVNYKRKADLKPAVSAKPAVKDPKNLPKLADFIESRAALAKVEAGE